jgi:hypothetical protein
MARRKLAGSLFNRLQEHSAYQKPEVGMGATQLMYTDRLPFTITRVSDSGKTFWAKEDVATRTDSNGISECQSWEFTPDPNAPEVEVRWTGKGWKRKGHSSFFAIGKRERYHDFSF